MAYIKIKWRKHDSKKYEMSASKYEKYLFQDRGTELWADSEHCNIGHAINEFAVTQHIHGKDRTQNGKQVNLAMEVIQSFSIGQSKHLTAKHVNHMGMGLAKRFAKNHEYFVVTHTDTHKIHNHIMINPVSHVTGKRDLTDRKAHLYSLRNLSDHICRENGLTIIHPSGKDKEVKVPQAAKEIERRGGKSYRLDLLQKADYARSFATSFDEFVGYLDILSVKVAITDKNITYFYEGHNKGIRGSKLGTRYDKEGLIKNFKEVDEKFQYQPQLRAKAISNLELMKNGRRTNQIKKDYHAFTKSDRKGNRTPIPSEEDLKNSIIPMKFLKEASSMNIADYCKSQGIALTVNSKGQTVLKGREFVVIDENRWTNTKNYTVGSLIEFVSNYRQVNYLGAMAEILDNKNLLFLEQYSGEVKHTYTSFYVPKEKRAVSDKAKESVKDFLRVHGIRTSYHEEIMERNNIQVDKSGNIWFVSNDKHGAVEYFKTKDGSYQFRTHGNASEPIFRGSEPESRVKVFTDMTSYIKYRGRDSFSKYRSQSDIALNTLNEKGLHLFLAENPHVREMEFIDPQSKDVQKEHQMFMEGFKKSIKGFNIEIISNSIERSRQLDQSIGLDL